MTHQILVLGSSNIDLLVRIPRFHQGGETIPGENPKTFFGGKGANQAIASKRLGGKVLFVTKLGGDDYGKSYRRYLIRSGLDPRGILQDKKLPTGMALIELTPEGENRIIVSPGANGSLSERDLEKLGPLWKRVNVFMTQGETPLHTVKTGLKLAKRNGAITLFNPSPPHRSYSDLFSMVDYLVLNEWEAQYLTGIKGMEIQKIRKMADRLLKKGIPHVIITLGAKGLFYKNEKEEIRLKPFKVKVIDSTAAGDAFLGGLACGLSRGMPVREALQYANGAGALAATRLGAQPSLPFKKNLEIFLSRHKE